MRLQQPAAEQASQYPEMAESWRISMMRECKKILEYKKDVTYYCVASYDMFRIYVIYFIMYWVATHYSFLFTLFVVAMISAVLYVLEKVAAIQLRRLFDLTVDDSYSLLPPSRPPPPHPPHPPHPTYTQPTYDTKSDTVTYSFTTMV